MTYTVVETQNKGGTLSTQSWAFTDKKMAFEKFFQTGAYVPNSDLDEHTVTISCDGNMAFTSIVKSAIV